MNLFAPNTPTWSFSVTWTPSRGHRSPGWLFYRGVQGWAYLRIPRLGFVSLHLGRASA